MSKEPKGNENQNERQSRRHNGRVRRAFWIDRSGVEELVICVSRPQPSGMILEHFAYERYLARPRQSRHARIRESRALPKFQVFERGYATQNLQAAIGNLSHAGQHDRLTLADREAEERVQR